ncbi:carbohydrate binding domain-containing protein [bacterium]|nr:carbohydrate binding domain-containing protein [bacterium]
MGHAYTPTPTGNNYGVSGWVGGSEVVNIALGGYADAADSTDGSNFGVDAKANAATVNGFNYGVYTQASNAPLNYGIHSRADGTVGSNYGIHASASGGENNYAGYFVGDVVVTEGTLTADVTLASAPTEEMDAATKGYVDQLIAELQAEIQILKWKTSPLIGSWKLAPEAGALGVGPDLNNVSWWSNLSSDVTTRACLFDDEYVFGADGSFQNVLGTQTWLDPWQGTNPAACGAPVAPHNGTATATYNYDEAAGTITINGTGAFLGLAQVINGAQIASPADAASSITYIAAISDDGATLDLDIEYATPEGPSGFWSFKLVKGLHPDDVDNDNDGYTENQGDCDDIDASINPAATEIEDNIDNDCDGEIDEGFLVCDPETTESYSASNLNMTFQSDPSEDFISDGANFSWVDNPDFDNAVNTSCKVGKVVKANNNPWDSNQYDLDAKLDFNSNSGLKIKVWSARANTEVRLKLEDIGNAGNNIEKFFTTSVTSGWEELTFPFSAADSGKFNKIIIFFDLGANNTDTYYFDDLKLYGAGAVGNCPVVPAGELLANGDFEAGDVGCWILLDGVTISATVSNGGTQSAELQGSTGVAVVLKMERFGVGLVQPNTSYTVQFDIIASDGLGEGRVKAFTFSEGAVDGTVSATQHTLTNNTTSISTTSWETKTFTFTTPENANQLEGGLSFLIEIVNSAARLNVDNVSVRLTP